MGAFNNDSDHHLSPEMAERKEWAERLGYTVRKNYDPTSTVPFKRSFQHNSLCGLRRLLALHFRGFEDQASCSRMLGGRATPAAWKTRPT